MAEFKEVTSILKRKYKDMGLFGFDLDTLDKIEQEALKWAAEHPESVYPTWEEWLVANGIMEPDNVRLNGDFRFYYNGKPVYNIPSPKMFDPIPADIAQKLGIEPKEG